MKSPEYTHRYFTNVKVFPVNRSNNDKKRHEEVTKLENRSVILRKT